eukprot:3563306-Amphidinium_carterae.1
MNTWIARNTVLEVSLTQPPISQSGASVRVCAAVPRLPMDTCSQASHAKKLRNVKFSRTSHARLWPRLWAQLSVEAKGARGGYGADFREDDNAQAFSSNLRQTSVRASTSDTQLKSSDNEAIGTDFLEGPSFCDSVPCWHQRVNHHHDASSSNSHGDLYLRAVRVKWI